MNKTWIYGGLAALLVAAFLSPWASASPDGLERVAEDLGFLSLAAEGAAFAPISDYAFPGVAHEGVATALAGVAGVLLTFVVMFGLGKGLTFRKKT